MSSIADQFHAERELSFATQRAERASRDADWDRRSEVMRAQREHLLTLLRPAQKWEYEAWLTGFLRQGGKVTHFYDYDWPARNFYTAMSDLVITPLYGALALNVIVPKGIRLLGATTGHCNVYLTAAHDDGDIFLYQGFHDAAPHNQPRCVPAYSNTELLA